MSIEEEFFKTFGIEKRHDRDFSSKGEVIVSIDKYYPEITDRILLELICILNTVTEPDLGDINYARLRISILEQCIEAVTEDDWGYREPTKEEFFDDVRSLFEGVEE